MIGNIENCYEIILAPILLFFPRKETKEKEIKCALVFFFHFTIFKVILLYLHRPAVNFKFVIYNDY